MRETIHFWASRVRRSHVVAKWDWLWRRVDPLWQRFYARLVADEGVVTFVNGDRFNLMEDFGTRYGRHKPRVYEPEVYVEFARAIRPGMCVVDIGAHIGLYTLAAAKRVGNGRVYAFEPTVLSATTLRRHVEMNGWSDRVDVTECVVSDIDGIVPFYSAETTTAASLARANAEELNRERIGGRIHEEQVPSTTLDRFAASIGRCPDVIKIDAEGAELRILRGAYTVLRDGSPVILCEVHPDQMRSCGGSVAELEAFLSSVGYDWELIDSPNSVGIFHWKITTDARAGGGRR